MSILKLNGKIGPLIPLTNTNGLISTYLPEDNPITLENTCNENTYSNLTVVNLNCPDSTFEGLQLLVSKLGNWNESECLLASILFTDNQLLKEMEFKSRDNEETKEYLSGLLMVHYWVRYYLGTKHPHE